MAVGLDPYSYYGDVLCTQALGPLTLTETAYSGAMLLPDHSHGSSHLAVLLEGSYLERVNSTARLCLPGDAVYYAPDVRHENWFGATFGRCLNFEFPEHLAPPNPCRTNGTYMPAEIHRLVATEGRETETVVPDWISEARRRIDSCPGLSLGPLADGLCVHPSHLARSFRRAYGLSVGRYAKFSRIRASAKMIVESSARFGEISLLAGFYDQSHFSNTFAQVTGFSPGALRRAAQA